MFFQFILNVLLITGGVYFLYKSFTGKKAQELTDLEESLAKLLLKKQSLSAEKDILVVEVEIKRVEKEIEKIKDKQKQ